MLKNIEHVKKNAQIMRTYQDRFEEEITKMEISAVAKTLGVARNTIYNWIATGNAPLKSLAVLHDVLGLDIDYVITGTRRGPMQYTQSQSQAGAVRDGDGVLLNTRERALIENYRKIKDEKDRDAIERMVKLAADVKKD